MYKLFLFFFVITSVVYADTVHILAVDVETAGSQLFWPCISVEFCHSVYDFKKKQLTVVGIKRFSMQVTIDQIEPKCYCEYWQKNIEKFFELQKHALPYEKAAEQIALYVENLLKEYPDITVISDNATFDIARLNVILESQNREPIAYRPDNVYQMPVDLGSLARAVAVLENTEDAWLSRDIASEKLLGKVPKDTLKPGHAMCWRYVMYMEKIHRYRKSNIQFVHILGIDVKAAGSELRWPTISIGFSHATYDFTTRSVNFIELKRFDIKVELNQFEPRCYEELWQHRLESYNLFQKTAQPYDTASRAITNYVKELLDAFPSIVVVSDNIAFDVFRLNALLESVNEDPISYRPDDVYQMPVDLAELERTLAIVRNGNNTWLTRDVDSSVFFLSIKNSCPIKNERHFPEEAAAVCCWKYSKYLEELQKYKKVGNYS